MALHLWKFPFLGARQADQRRVIRLGFGLALLLLSAIALFSYQTTRELVHATESVAQSHTTVQTLEHLLGRVKDVRFGVAAYLTLEDRQALEVYYEALPAITQEVNKLQQLFLDNPQEQHKLTTLQQLLAELTAESKVILALEKTQGERAAIRQLQTGPQRNKVNDIIRVIWDLQYQETKALDIRKATAARSGEYTLLVIGIGNVLVILLGGCSLWLGHHELTARQRAEEQAVQAKEEAEAANHSKSAFLATMSHEIRTPLNVLIGTADLLTETSLTDTQRAYMRIAQNASQSLLTLINDILDLSKIEAGRITLESTTIDLDVLLGDVCEVLATSAHQKGIELCYHIAADVPSHLLGDPTRLRQILVNLVGNAVKFTSQGEIVVAVQRARASAGHGEAEIGSQCELCFSVKDTGVGIPTGQQEVIFESFTQADSSTTRHFGGTGLGLTIVRHLVHLLKGKVWVESYPGQGSTFFFTGQFSVDSALASASGSSPRLDECTILILDPNRTARRSIGEVLRSAGAMIIEAVTITDSRTALQHTQASGQTVDVALIACDLPEGDGIDMACSLRGDPEHRQLKVVMLARVGKADDLTRCQTFALPLVTKPTRRTQLLTVLQQILTNSEPQTVPVGTSAPPRHTASVITPAVRVLLVEDDPHNRLLFQAYLAHTNALVDIAENGKSGVAKFTTGVYDLVLMDIHMPEMDGFAATQAIRAWEKEQVWPATPIVALTASTFEEDKQKIASSGFTESLAKPITKAALLTLLSTHHQELRTGLTSKDRPTRPPVTVAVPRELQEIVPRYLDSQKETAVLVLFALEQHDYQTVQGLGHKLKGNGTMFGFPKLSDIGAALEVAAREKNMAELRKHQQELSSYLQHVAVVYQ